MSFPSEKQLRDRFAQAENAVYFATADKRSRYYGFGIAEELIGASFEEVADWAKPVSYTHLTLPTIYSV